MIRVWYWRSTRKEKYEEQCKQCYRYGRSTLTSRHGLLGPPSCTLICTQPDTDSTPSRPARPADMIRRRDSPRRAQSSDAAEPASLLHHFVEPQLFPEICTYPHTTPTAKEAFCCAVEMALMEGLGRWVCMLLRVVFLEPVSLLCAVDGKADVGARQRESKEHKLHQEPGPAASFLVARHARGRLAGLGST